jgi:lysophospholipase L1-like esterase
VSPRARRTRRLQEAALVLGSVLLTLLVLEVVFRALDIRGYHAPRVRDWSHALLDAEHRVPGIHLQFKPHATFALRYESNPRGYLDSDASLTYETNNHGLRGPDFELAKPPGTLRVVVLGDSFTFGEGVRLEDTFCQRLQGRLRQALAPTPVEVLNFGVSAWSTGEEILFLEHFGIKVEPDLVVVVFVGNDAYYAGRLDLWNNFTRMYESRALRHSYVVSWAYASIGRALLARRYVEALVGRALERKDKWREALEALSRGKRLASSVGARYMVALFPFMYELDDDYPLLPIHRLVIDHCTRESIPVIDLLGAFEGRRYRDLWVHPTDQHPNETAHRIAAEALAQFVLEQRLLVRP